MPHPVLALLVAATLQAGRSHGLAFYVVNEAVDTPTPGKSCDGGCNLRTAWALAGEGDTISVEVDPVMDGPLSNATRNKFGWRPISLRGNMTGGGRAAVTPKSPGYEFMKYSRDNFGSLNVENLVFEGFNGTGVFNLLPSQKPFADGNFLFSNTVFKRNVVTNGVISLWEGANLTIRDSQFLENRAEGLSLIFCFGMPSCEVKRSEFRGNVALRSELISTGGFVNSIDECLFVDNDADPMFSSETYTGLHNTRIMGLKGGLTGGKQGAGGWNVTAVWAVKTGGYIATGVRGADSIRFTNSTFRTAHPEGSISLAGKRQHWPLAIINVDPGPQTSQLTTTSSTRLGTCKETDCFKSQCKAAFNSRGQVVGTKCVKTSQDHM